MPTNRLVWIVSGLALALLGQSVWYAVSPTATGSKLEAQIQQNDAENFTSNSFEYAQVTFNEATSKVLIERGNTNVAPVEVDLPLAIRQMGGNNRRPTFANLLDLIGGEGWELILIENGKWIFKRAI